MIRFIFTTLCIGLTSCQRQLDTASTEHILYSDFKQLHKSIVSKFQSLKKHKSFNDLIPIIDTILDSIHKEEDDIETLEEFTQSWILEFYGSDSQFIKTLIN